MLRQLLVFWASMGLLTCMAHVTFTNLRCSFTNITFGEYEQCHIKAVNRTHKYINIYGKLYFKPLDKITANIKFMHKDHGYKPFFIDITIDVCKFLKSQRNLFASILYNTFKDRSNLNHTCPYDHDLIIEKLWTGNYDTQFTKYLPVPNGDYAIYIIFYNDNIQFNNIQIYSTITN